MTKNPPTAPQPKRALRQYEPIWLRLKEKGYARVACLPKDQARIRKAVWKEKDLDKGFKIEAEVDDKSKRRLLCILHDTYMEFKLVATRSQLSAGDL